MSTTSLPLPKIILLPRSLSSFIALHPTIQTSNSTSTSATQSSTTLSLGRSESPTTSTTLSNSQTDEAINMHTRTRRNNGLVESRTTKPTLMTRLRGRNARTRTVKTTTTVEPRSANHVTARRSKWGRTRREPVVHHRRHASIGDKISGAMLKLKGSLTRRPGVKAAGTRRMHGTDGRGSHRVY